MANLSNIFKGLDLLWDKVDMENLKELIRDENAIQNDEKLEKAIFRVSENKQINLFE